MYTIFELLFLFFIYSFLGWCTEVCFRSVNNGVFVNSGFLNGPYCPIYGVGMLFVIYALYPISDNLLLLFIGSFVLTTLLEYLTGIILHKLFKTRWWDYTDMPFNIGGYVCPAFSLMWGLGACFVVKFIHPAIETIVFNINSNWGWMILFVLTALLIVDIIASILTIKSLNNDLKRLNKITEELRGPSDFIACHLGNKAIEIDEKYNEKRLDMQAKLDMVKADIMDVKVKNYYRIVKAFPNMKHDRYNEQLIELKEKVLKKFKQPK